MNGNAQYATILMIRKKATSDYEIAPGKVFKDISDDWVSPFCGVDKSMFEKVE